MRLRNHSSDQRRPVRSFRRGLVATFVVTFVAMGSAHGAGHVAAAATAPVDSRQATNAAGSIAKAAPVVINVRKYGAKGDGSHDDSQAVQRAIDAASRRPGASVLLPRGVYNCPTRIKLASHVNLEGEGMSASWLKGHLDFGSRSIISKLKVGTAGVTAVANLPGATHTTFSYVRFRGGGATYAPVVVLGGCRGSHRSCSFIAFRHSEVERNLGAETDPPSKNLNDITILSSYRSGETAVHDITFDHCHVGVSNGQGGWDIGSPRMALEAWADDHASSGGSLSQSQTGQKPFYNITVTNCVFEATDWSVLDFSDRVTCNVEHQFDHSATGVVVRANVLHGAGHRWAKGMGRITFEGPADSTCTSNSIYQGDALGSAIQIRSWEVGEVTRSGNVLHVGYGDYVDSPHDP